MRRVTGGAYRTLDGAYRVVRDWEGRKGWSVLRRVGVDDWDVQSVHPTLRDARKGVPE